MSDHAEDENEICPRCGVLMSRNDYGVIHCKPCQYVQPDPEPIFRTRRYSDDEETSAMAQLLNRTDRRLHDRRKAGEVAGTIYRDGTLRFIGSLDNTRKICLAGTGYSGTIESATVRGSAGDVQTGFNKDRPYIKLKPVEPGYQDYEVTPHFMRGTTHK